MTDGRSDSSAMPHDLPLVVATLCDLRDARGRVLLLERSKPPNHGLWSPIGGKLDQASGESPARCAQREVQEEAGISIPLDRLHLVGLISERAFEGKWNMILFYFRVLGAVEAAETRIREGRLAWHEPESVDALALPKTDRDVIWPLVRRAEARGREGRPGFFSVHIDCAGPTLRWTVEEER